MNDLTINLFKKNLKELMLKDFWHFKESQYTGLTYVTTYAPVDKDGDIIFILSTQQVLKQIEDIKDGYGIVEWFVKWKRGFRNYTIEKFLEDVFGEQYADDIKKYGEIRIDNSSALAEII